MHSAERREDPLRHLRDVLPHATVPGSTGDEERYAEE
jgi:hypothetical protein